MPLSRHDLRTKQQVEEGVNALREIGKLGPAATIAGLLTPAGAAFVTRLYAERVPSPLPVSMPETERAHVKACAEESGDNLSTLADQAMYEFVEGIFQPRPYTRSISRGEPAERSNLNVKIDKRLRDRVEELLRDEAFVEDLGWKPRGTGVVVRLWLQERFPLFEGLVPDDVIDAYAGGESVQELAERLDVAPDVISLLLTRNGVLLRERQEIRNELGDGRKQLSRPEVAEMIRRYTEDKVGTYVLAREYGVSPKTIIRTLDREGIERRPTRGKGTAD